jgi:hypothetical protein
VDTLALVESPAQLLHLLEWVHAAGAAERTRVVVLAPVEATSVAQLRVLADYAAEEHLHVDWIEARTSLPGRIGALRTLASAIRSARRLVIGDPFSGMIQALLLTGHPRDVIVVDDGTATLEFASQLASGEPLRRWDAPPSPLELARAPLARNARRVFGAGRVRLFTVMPVAGLPASHVVRHNYDWTRRRFGPPRTFAGVDVVGSSLVESGVVRMEPYLETLVNIAARTGRPGRYFAHRKESEMKLAALTRATGLQVVRPDVPLEIELRRGPVASVLATFPSSVGYTLPLVLAGVGTRISYQQVPAAMLTPRVGDAARRFLDRLSDDLGLNSQGDLAAGLIALSASA